LRSLEQAFAVHGRDLACLVIEPIAGNMNFVRASLPFMQRCRELCTQHGALLVFDEVMTGCRVALGSAQSVYARALPGFEPDMTILGKVIGGGMPLAAFGARRAVMQQLAPLGPVYQAGTLSGNPVATACGLATLREIRKPGFFEALSARTRSLVDGLTGAAKAAGVPFSADCEGGMFGFFLLPELPQNYARVMQSDSARFNRLFHGMLERGVYLAPALYEAGFVSAAHTDADIAATVDDARGTCSADALNTPGAPGTPRTLAVAICYQWPRFSAGQVAAPAGIDLVALKCRHPCTGRLSMQKITLGSLRAFVSGWRAAAQDLGRVFSSTPGRCSRFRCRQVCSQESSRRHQHQKSGAGGVFGAVAGGVHRQLGRPGLGPAARRRWRKCRTPAQRCRRH
jgi:hypothetical protein